LASTILENEKPIPENNMLVGENSTPVQRESHAFPGKTTRTSMENDASVQENGAHVRRK
jgi:hypothetical protein